MNYFGTIIEESLENPSIMKELKVLSTKIEPIEDKHQTPWAKQWTLHKVEILESVAASVAEKLSHLIDTSHVSSWYADYKNEQFHYIIFRDKIFKVDRAKKEQYAEATKYGISLGIPDYQVNFSKDILEK